MKKLLIAVLPLLFLVNVQGNAQSPTLLPLRAGDTLVMSASSDTVTKVIPSSAGYSSLAIQVNVTKVSGTVAGKAYLASSLDGVNYTVTDSSAAFTDQTTNVAFFTKTPPPYGYYQVRVRPMGAATATMQGIVRVWFVAKKYD
jgi:hypothetical protein